MAVPPPGTTPSSTAANVAFFASSIRNLRSSSSVSVDAPTLMTATPPPSFAIRSASFSVSYTESVSASSFLICAIRALISSLLPAVAMIVEVLFDMDTLRAVPRTSTSHVSIDIPRSLATYSAPVTIAMSCRRALRRSPKPGAFMADTFNTPRSLFTTRVARASPVISSAMIRRGAFSLLTFSRIGINCLICSSFSSVIRTLQFSNSTIERSWLVMNWGEMYPLSISMPSSTSTVVSKEVDDSIEITPSDPTFSMASATISPTKSSFPADMLAMALMSSVPSTGLDFSFSSSTRAFTVLSMPFFKATGLKPAATACRPSFTNSRARTLAVVVPSPAASFVRPATSLISWAPAFSTGSSKSILLAIVTPSLITLGAENFSSSTTLRPRGPRVTPTASATLSMPA
mmetsp:Transcript_13516/g.49173  ORF Transcript_13516/g.49173 Transcript_13516/m.49173 type:complete len:403 (-) Transcript_13516:219-1427(-)